MIGPLIGESQRGVRGKGVGRYAAQHGRQHLHRPFCGSTSRLTLTESCKIRKQNALAAPRSGLVISHSLAASNPAMEFVMIRLILFAWFALAVILLVATDLSEDHHLKQITSTYFAQNDNYGAEYQTRHTIRHHS